VQIQPPQVGDLNKPKIMRPVVLVHELIVTVCATLSLDRRPTPTVAICRAQRERETHTH
jgi:hypothetical protein